LPYHTHAPNARKALAFFLQGKFTAKKATAFPPMLQGITCKPAQSKNSSPSTKLFETTKTKKPHFLVRLFLYTTQSTPYPTKRQHQVILVDYCTQENVNKKARANAQAFILHFSFSIPVYFVFMNFCIIF
jgi:hypothetical protein